MKRMRERRRKRNSIHWSESTDSLAPSLPASIAFQFPVSGKFGLCPPILTGRRANLREPNWGGFADQGIRGLPLSRIF